MYPKILRCILGYPMNYVYNQTMECISCLVISDIPNSNSWVHFSTNLSMTFTI